MSQTTYSARIRSKSKCKSCAKDFITEVDELLIGTPLEIMLDIADAVSIQRSQDGWRKGNCPDCAHEHRARILAEHNADSYRDMEVAK